jgi:hypothetical protein
MTNLMVKYLSISIITLAFQFIVYAQRNIDKNSNNNRTKIEQFLKNKNSFQGYQETDLSFIITNEINDNQLNSTFVYTRQKVNEIEVYNAISTFIIKNENVRNTSNRFVKNIIQQLPRNSIHLNPEIAYRNALNQLNILNIKEIKLFEIKSESIQTLVVDYQDTVKTQLMYLPIGNKLIQVWNFVIKDFKNNHWWDVCVDANTGVIIQKNDWIHTCHFVSENYNNDNFIDKCIYNQSSNEEFDNPQKRSVPMYNVFPLPFESPLYTNRKNCSNPFGTNYSTNGWHDDNGLNGDITTKGNNVYAYEDIDADNNPGYSPTANSMYHFDFDFDTLKDPKDYLDASITQLFYVNNMVHDITYSYGFDEESGNFQAINFTNKGIDNDFVLAEAQDGKGFNNANFGSPPDGQNPRMQMYLWKTENKPAKILKIESPSKFIKEIDGLFAEFGPKTFPNISNTEVILYRDNIIPDSNDACENPINGVDFTGKIVVLKRGICKFIEKIKRAQDYGAVAVIVVNNTSNSILQMGGGGTNELDSLITIPSLMISLEDGTSLINSLSNNKVTASILPSNISPDRDSDFDNGIIIHEYTHGISTRLTGGPSNSSCLNNDEQMGEGWSDYFALMLTARSHDFIKDRRAMGLYAISQDTSGSGIRPAPYSTNFSVNNFTYGNVQDSVQLTKPHGIGFVWATMLWDMTAGLVKQHGFDQDLVNGKGGNNLALKLVTYALKLQPCNPGFQDGRDAIILADELLYNSEHKNIIWCAFAKRGLGYSASQGSSLSRFDQVEAFDLPPNTVISVNSCGPYTWPVNNTTYTKSGTYNFLPTTDCSIASSLNLTISNPLDTSVSIQEGNILKANLPSANYQWLDCNNQNKKLVLETNQMFQPTNSGSFAVIISTNSCVDTSACYSFKTLNLNNIDWTNEISIFPNPSQGEIYINLNQIIEEIRLKIVDISGKIVYQTNFKNSEKFKINPNLEKGAYELELFDGTGNYLRQKIVIIY